MAAGYTVRVRLTASTTPTAATVFGGCLSFIDNDSDEGDLFTDNQYPLDLHVFAGVTQIDCNVEKFTADEVIVAFRLQADIAGDTTDATTYKLAWGREAPTVKRDLSKVYLLADDFLTSLAGAYYAIHCTPTTGDGTLALGSLSGDGDPSGVYVPVPQAVDHDLEVFAYLKASLASALWTTDASRVGLVLRARPEGGGVSNHEGYEVVFHQSDGHGPLALLNSGIAWGANYSDFGSLPADDWVGLRFKMPSDDGTVSVRVWELSSAEPSTWQLNDTFPSYGSWDGIACYLLIPNNNTDGIVSTFRHLRVIRAVPDDPTVITS